MPKVSLGFGARIQGEIHSLSINSLPSKCCISSLKYCCFYKVHSVRMLFHRFKLQYCQHHDRFYQFWMKCPEISSNIGEFTVSVQVPCLNLDDTISGGDPLRCLQFR